MLLAPALARADDGEQLTMPAKRGMLHAQVGINLSKDAVGKPISISPDIWYGINDKLTIGLVHSFVGATGIQGIPGTSLCVTGADNGCADVYNFAGLDLRYTLTSGENLQLALDGGLFMTALDPFQLALKVGLNGRYRASDTIAIDFAPSIFFGLTERDGSMTSAGNKERLALPVNLVLNINEQLGLLAQLGLILPFQNAGDLYTLGFSIGPTYAFSKQFSAELAFSLPAVLTGVDDAGGVDARTLTLGGAYAF